MMTSHDYTVMLVMVYAHVMITHDMTPAVITTTSTELATTVLADWQQVAGAWLLSFPSRATRDAYRRDLQQFVQFCSDHQVPVLGAGRPVCDAYARQLDQSDLSAATRARRLAAVASFYQYALEADLITRNPVAGVRRPKVAAESPRLGLTRTEVRSVMEVLTTSTPAERALFGLLLGCGLRVSEAVGVTPAMFGTEAGHTVLRIVGKGAKPRTVVVAPQVMHLLHDALQASSDPATTLVRGPRGGRVDRHEALRWVVRIGHRAGLQRALCPHDLRHTAGTMALDAGASIQRVSDMLGHASTSTTQRYVAHRERLDNAAAYVLGMALVS